MGDMGDMGDKGDRDTGGHGGTETGRCARPAAPATPAEGKPAAGSAGAGGGSSLALTFEASEFPQRSLFEGTRSAVVRYKAANRRISIQSFLVPIHVCGQVGPGLFFFK